MFSVIIATHDSERALVATLAALVPGATAGMVREVIVADAKSSDDTEQVADIAGCRFLSSGEPPGARLKEAATLARGEWLMFLRPGVVPDTTWIDDTIAFVQKAMPGAAVFAAQRAGIVAWVGSALGLMPNADQGLILRKSFYDELGGHRDTAAPETDLLRRIGRRRIATLRTIAARTDI